MTTAKSNTTLGEAQKAIETALMRMTAEGGPGNFTMVSSGAYYLQFALDKGAKEAHVEAVARSVLADAGETVEPAQYEKLEEHGFGLQGDNANATQRRALEGAEDAAALASMTVKVLGDVFGRAPLDAVDIELVLE